MAAEVSTELQDSIIARNLTMFKSRSIISTSEGPRKSEKHKEMREPQTIKIRMSAKKPRYDAEMDPKSSGKGVLARMGTAMVGRRVKKLKSQYDTI